MVIVFDQVTLMMTVQIYVIYDLLCLGSEVSETFLNVSFYSFFFFYYFLFHFLSVCPDLFPLPILPHLWPVAYIDRHRPPKTHESHSIYVFTAIRLTASLAKMITTIIGIPHHGISFKKIEGWYMNFIYPSIHLCLLRWTHHDEVREVVWELSPPLFLDVVT